MSQLHDDIYADQRFDNMYVLSQECQDMKVLVQLTTTAYTQTHMHIWKGLYIQRTNQTLTLM